jgi:hypothetical protein
MRSIATVKSSSVTASPLRHPGDLVEINICGKLYLGGVHFQDFATSGAVRAVNQHRFAATAAQPAP